jgi:hypothetical protein
MDTLTNVVAILVFILVMVQINTSRRVEKMLSDLPMVTGEELAKKEAELAQAKISLTKLEQDLAKTDPNKLRDQLRKTDQELLSLDQQKKSTQAALVAKSALEKEWAKRETELATKKKQMEELLAKRDALLASLQQVAQQKPAESKVVKIPNARPLPENARKQVFLVANQRIFSVNEDEVTDLAMKEIRSAQGNLRPEREDRNGKSVAIYDQNKLHALFNSRRLYTREFDLALPLNPPWTRMNLKLTPRANAGEPLDRINQFNSQFQISLRDLRSKPNVVVWFLVMPNSFDAYLQARQIADAAGLPAGWQVVGEAAHFISLREVEVRNLVTAPKANPDAIPPPKQTLD